MQYAFIGTALLNPQNKPMNWIFTSPFYRLGQQWLSN